MKNCPNCGSPIDPYRVKCEYCGTMYFDWATWLRDGEPCYINYSVGNNATITTRAIPHLEAIEVSSEPTCIDYMDNTTHCFLSNKYCDMRVNFSCISDPSDQSLFKVIMEE